MFSVNQTRPAAILAALAGSITLSVVALPAFAKTPGSTYCFNGICHTVKTLAETRRIVGQTVTLKTSFYDDAKVDRFNPSNVTSSGEYFDASRPDNAASPIYPDGTKLLVWHAGSKKAVVVRINNAGPYWGDRTLDLSRGAAEVFGIGRAGVATVKVTVIEAPTQAEATYRKGREYAPVKGFVGRYASIDEAFGRASGGAASTRVASLDIATKPAKKTKAAPIVVAALAPAKPAPVVPKVVDVKPAAVKPVTFAAAVIAVPKSIAVEKPAAQPVVVRGEPLKVEDLPSESPIVVGKDSTDENPLVAAVRRLAEQEQIKIIKVAQRQLERRGGVIR